MSSERSSEDRNGPNRILTRLLSTLHSKLQGHRTLRWSLYGAAVGCAGGLMACLVFFLLEWTTFFTFEELAGYVGTKPAGEHVVDRTADTPFRPWVLCLLPAVGGLISGLIVYRWAPEAEGHGTDAFIDAFHNRQGHIRTRVPFVKGIASVITLSTGGSAGREGPIAQIGAGIGSWIGRSWGVGVRERRLLLLAGCAAGLGAIFRAPLGGALTSIEVLYREDFEAEGIVLSIISSVVGYAIFTTIFGHEPIFAIPQVGFNHPAELVCYAALALVCVPSGFLYVRVFYGMRDRFFRRLSWKKPLIPAFGGLLVGIVGLWQPKVLSGGYGAIQEALRGELPTLAMFTLAGLKIACTSFTISSGGSGGVFGPSLFIGAMLGGAVGQLSQAWMPTWAPHPGAVALVGMGAFFAGVAKAPIGALLMVCEMTGGYGLVVPLMFGAVICILLSQRWSLYEKQVLNKFHSPAHQSDRIINLLQHMKVADIYRRETPMMLLPEDMPLTSVRRLLTKTRESFFPVVDDSFHLQGILCLSDIREIMFEDAVTDLLVVGELSSPPASLNLDDSLYEALAVFLRSSYGQIPIEDPETGVIGIARFEDLMEAYHREVQRLKES